MKYIQPLQNRALESPDEETQGRAKITISVREKSRWD